MRRMRSIVIAGICCLMAATCGVLAQKEVTPVFADETGEPTILTGNALKTALETDLATNFYMDGGAAVRKVAPVGIRYTTFVSKTWYEKITANEATVEFFTSINKFENDENEAVPVEPTAKELDKLEAFLINEEATEWEYTGAIVYNNLSGLTGAQVIEAHNMQLEGQAYAVITDKDGAEITINAVQDDNVRSMAEVADIAMRKEAAGTDDYTPDDETMLNGYRTIKTAIAYVEKTGATFDVATVFEGATAFKASHLQDGVTYDEETGTYSFDIDVSAITEAQKRTGVIYTDKGIIEANFNVCTKVLKTAADFSVLTADGKVTGYYYLANNVEGYGKVASFKKVDSSKCFAGVFDGGGHYANLTIGTNRGLFGYLNAATIKNVQFNLKINPIVSTGDNYKNIPGLANALWSGVKITDTYIKVVDILNLNGGTFAPIANTMYKVVNFTRTVIEMPTAEYFTEKSIDTSKISAMGNSVPTFNLTTGVEEADLNGNLGSEIFVISHLPLARNIQNNYSSAAFTLYAPNTMVDTNDDGNITVDDIDATNKVTYYGQKVKTNGRQVYAYATVDALKAVNHTFTSVWQSSSWDLTSGVPVFVG